MSVKSTTDLMREHTTAMLHAFVNKADMINANIAPVHQPAKPLSFWELYEKENPTNHELFYKGHPWRFK